MKRLLPPCCVLLGVLLFAGCDPKGEGRYNAGLAQADKRIAAQDFEGAVRIYESLLDGTPKTAEAHYRLGHLFADRIKDPLGALYHFSRYVAVAPDGPFSKEAKAFQKDGEFRLLTQLSKGAPLTQEEMAKIKNENLSLRKQLAELKAIKTPPPAVVAVGGKTAPGTGQELAQKPIPPGARTHKVASGETLASIAAKYYKNKGRWKDILDANFYSAEAAKKLKEGQELVIP